MLKKFQQLEFHLQHWKIFKNVSIWVQHGKKSLDTSLKINVCIYHLYHSLQPDMQFYHFSIMKGNYWVPISICSVFINFSQNFGCGRTFQRQRKSSSGNY